MAEQPKTVNLMPLDEATFRRFVANLSQEVYRFMESTKETIVRTRQNRDLIEGLEKRIYDNIVLSSTFEIFKESVSAKIGALEARIMEMLKPPVEDVELTTQQSVKKYVDEDEDPVPDVKP